MMSKNEGENIREVGANVPNTLDMDKTTGTKVRGPMKAPRWTLERLGGKTISSSLNCPSLDWILKGLITEALDPVTRFYLCQLL